ncbi:unnamed protein product [Leptidea sinapis]|uniref:Uncharacterized protein n=1 Tax=Leptidea sinapis TaxID=189913 RepID=A0A5E4Q2D3_9NEOP|nr:unnamed protein product [Leptidea sinapis]
MESDRVNNENIDQSMEIKEPDLTENEQKSCANKPSYDVSNTGTESTSTKEIENIESSKDLDLNDDDLEELQHFLKSVD